MQKISDFFDIEAFYDNSEGFNGFYFSWDDGDEEYLYNYDTKSLIKGDSKNFTWELIQDWFKDHDEEIILMLKNNDIHYIEDPF